MANECSSGSIFRTPSVIFVLSSILMTSQCVDDVKNITIGVMLSLEGPKRMGDEAAKAIDLSLEYINNSPDFATVRRYGYQFIVTIDSVPCEPSDAFKEMLDIFSHSGQHRTDRYSLEAYVGPSCDEVCQPGGRLAKYYDVMMISYGCESSIFDDKNEFPTFGRTTPTFKDMEKFFADFIVHYKWPRVTLITMTTPVWQETLSEFEAEIEARGVTVFRLSLASQDQILQEDFRVTLRNESARSRVFVLLMYPDTVVEFMKKADAEGLRDGRHAFLSVDLAGLFSQIAFENTSFLDGLLDVSYDIRPETTSYMQFVENITELPKDGDCQHYEYGIHPMLVSDGILVVAGIFNRSLSLGLDITRGSLLANLTRGNSFTGLIHDITMDEKGNREARFMIHNIQRGCYVPVARTGKDGQNLDFVTSRIIWPGGSVVAPAGQDKCGWYNELCQHDDTSAQVLLGSTIGAITFLFVIIVFVFIFCWWKKSLYHSRMLSTDWLKEWEEIRPRVVDPGLTTDPNNMDCSFSYESSCSLRSDVSNGTARTNSMSTYHCPVVRMDVEGVWTLKAVRRPTLSLTEAVKKELNLLRSLKHPNINSFMGACIKPGHVSLMWSYWPKGSLQDLIYSGVFKMEIMFQLSFAQDIAKGLAYLHNSDLHVHGRLKSSNVVVDGGLTCKLTDIDTPRFREGELPLPETDPNCWFQHVWTAPERLRSPTIPGSSKCDVYSYGIVLYEIMLKRKPFVTEEHMRTDTEPDWNYIIQMVKDPDKLENHIRSCGTRSPLLSSRGTIRSEMGHKHLLPYTSPMGTSVTGHTASPFQPLWTSAAYILAPHVYQGASSRHFDPHFSANHRGSFFPKPSSDHPPANKKLHQGRKERSTEIPGSETLASSRRISTSEWNFRHTSLPHIYPLHSSSLDLRGDLGRPGDLWGRPIKEESERVVERRSQDTESHEGGGDDKHSKLKKKESQEPTNHARESREQNNSHLEDVQPAVRFQFPHAYSIPHPTPSPLTVTRLPRASNDTTGRSCRLCCSATPVSPVHEPHDTHSITSNQKNNDEIGFSHHFHHRNYYINQKVVLRPEIPKIKHQRAASSYRGSRDTLTSLQPRRRSGDTITHEGQGTSEGHGSDTERHGAQSISKMVELMQLCWAEIPEVRPNADAILKKLRVITSGRSLSDNIEQIMTRYSEQLEETVKERTRRLEEEKAKYFRVLCEVIPQKYVSSLVSGNKVEAESFSKVTIFFSDIVGFTNICGKCSPQEVLDFLNDLYTRFDVILNSYNVYKVETIGDAYMVAAGIPEPIPDHAQQIAHMALHLLSASVHVRAPSVDASGQKSTQCLKLRIGLNSGPVVAGIVGEKMPRYCLYGNTVNIASRMESNGKPLRIHMSLETTKELEAIGGFEIAYRGLISVKGKDKPVPTYWLINSQLRPFDLPDYTLLDD